MTGSTVVGARHTAGARALRIAGWVFGGAAVVVIAAGHTVAGALGIVAAVLFTGVGIVHVLHARDCRWQLRAWHIGHVLMAAGMVLMNLPVLSPPPLAGQVVFCACALGAMLLGLTGRMRGHGLGTLWPAAVVDLLGMAYMYAEGSTWLTILFAAWFLVQAVCWATGRVPAREHHDRAVRITLVVMDLGMASMLLAMRFLATPMPHMHGM